MKPTFVPQRFDSSVYSTETGRICPDCSQPVAQKAQRQGGDKLTPPLHGGAGEAGVCGKAVWRLGERQVYKPFRPLAQ